MALISKLTSLADAIRAKAGISGSMTLTEMASAVAAIETGGGLTDEDLYLMGLLEEVPSSISEAMTSIPSAAFAGQRMLKYASFPNCSSIGGGAFLGCEALSFASFPEYGSIQNNTHNDIFKSCYNLDYIYIPKCVEIQQLLAINCTTLTHVSADMCQRVENYAFQFCSNLRQIMLPNASYLGASCFNGCRNLSMASFPKLEQIRDFAFVNCIRLKSLYLLGSSVVSLANTSVFSNSPLSAGGSGTVYVPSSLFRSYTSARVWSLISARLSSVSV